MSNVILICLILVAVSMIFIGFVNQILAPALTGIGFLLITVLFKKQQQ
jgi:small-conductance mechanosensitive channel